ncbi:hypothetical protein AHAS_Ahas04G0007300 [Arachis hypogaea]
MQSLTLSKRLSASKPIFRISPNLVTQSSTTSSSSTTSPPPSSPISTADGGSSCHSLALLSLLRAPRSATQSLRTGVSGSDVRDANLAGGQVRAYEVLKLYRPCYGTGIATFKVQPHGAAGYATATTTGDSIQSLLIPREEERFEEKRRERCSASASATVTATICRPGPLEPPQVLPPPLFLLLPLPFRDAVSSCFCLATLVLHGVGVVVGYVAGVVRPATPPFLSCSAIAAAAPPPYCLSSALSAGAIGLEVTVCRSYCRGATSYRHRNLTSIFCKLITLR